MTIANPSHFNSGSPFPDTSSMLSYAVEPWQSFISDPRCEDLMLEHYEWAEPAHRSRLAPGIDSKIYEALDSAGALKMIVARRDGRMIGYCALVIRRHLHYQAIAAFEDVYFLTASERGNGIGRKLLQTALAVAESSGARVSYWMTKEFESQAKLLESLGGEKFDSVYAIWLNGAEDGD